MGTWCIKELFVEIKAAVSGIQIQDWIDDRQQGVLKGVTGHVEGQGLEDLKFAKGDYGFPPQWESY